MILIIVARTHPAIAQNNVGIGTNSPAITAALDLTDPATGLLVPRMTTINKLAIATPATGLLVYDNVINTFYYFNGVAWVPFVSNSGPAGGWSTTGNLGTTAGTNFVGTTDLQDMVFKTNSVEGMRLSTAGMLGIGTNLPTSELHTVASGAKVANYTGNLLKNNATSSTASVTKYGAEVLSTGTWNGATATNVGLHVNATGGTTNYSGIFEGGNVGVNNTAPATKLDIAGDLSTRYTNYTAVNGANNNIVIGTSSFVRVTGPSAAYSITGVAGGVDGKMLTIFNSTAQTITISNESASSTAANRITTLASTGDVVINGKGGVDLIYSAADSRWLVVATSSTASFTTTGTIIKKKKLDQSISNTTSMVNDNDLFMPIAANDSVQIEGYIYVQGFNGGQDFILAFTAPAGSTMNIVATWDAHNGAVGQGVFHTSGTPSTNLDYNPIASLEQGVLFFGTIVTAGTAGNIQLQYTQLSSTAVVNTFRAGSYLQTTLIR